MMKIISNGLIKWYNSGRNEYQQTKSQMKNWYFVWVIIMMMVMIIVIIAATFLGHADEGARWSYSSQKLLIIGFGWIISMISALKLFEKYKGKCHKYYPSVYMACHCPVEISFKTGSKKFATRWRCPSCSTNAGLNVQAYSLLYVCYRTPQHIA